MVENGRKTWQVIEKIGGASRDRTDDLIVANEAFSQRSPLSNQPLTRLLAPKPRLQLLRICYMNCYLRKAKGRLTLSRQCGDEHPPRFSLCCPSPTTYITFVTRCVFIGDDCGFHPLHVRYGDVSRVT